MKHLILIFGDLASGKSTYADILSKRYKITALKKDDIKEILADTVGFKTREENLRLSFATFEIMLHALKRAIIAEEDLILESNLREAELARLESLAKEAGYSILSIHLTADTKILYERFKKRIEHGRHRAHLISGLMDYEGFCSYVTGQRSKSAPGQLIKINADNFNYQTDKRIFSEIDLFIKNL
jgi:predicted kinase